MGTTTPATVRSRRRLDYIDALRGAACLCVIAQHSFEHLAAPPGWGYLPEHVFLRLCGVGWLGVSLFLVLSGFCLFYPLSCKYPPGEIRLEVTEFARRRTRRILPPYYAMFVILLLVSLLRHSIDLPRDAANIAAHFVMVFNLSPSMIDSFNPAFWSLALECQLYILFPALVWLAGRWGLKGMLITTLIVSLFWQGLAFHRYGFSLTWTPALAVWYHALPGRCFEFAAGMVAANLVANPRKGQRRLACGVIAVLLGPALWYILDLSRFGPACDQMWGMIFAAILVVLSGVPNLRFTLSPPLRALTQLGTVSYSIYLTHQPLVLLITPKHLFLPFQDNLTFGLARIPLMIAIGYLFFLCFERPSLTMPKPKKVTHPGSIVSGEKKVKSANAAPAE